MAWPFSEREEAKLSRPPVASNGRHLWGVAGSKNKRAVEREKAPWWFLQSTINPAETTRLQPSFVPTIGR